MRNVKVVLETPDGDIDITKNAPNGNTKHIIKAINNGRFIDLGDDVWLNPAHVKKIRVLREVVESEE